MPINNDEWPWIGVFVLLACSLVWAAASEETEPRQLPWSTRAEFITLCVGPLAAHCREANEVSPEDCEHLADELFKETE